MGATIRQVSIVLEIEDMSQAGAFWDALKDNTLILGAKVTGIADGNAIAKIEELEDDLKDAWLSS